MKKVNSGGGWPAVKYTFRKAREAGGILKLYRAMRSKNACKTCALGMGGQRGGMVNERGKFPEVCKKSLQAMVADMQGAISTDFWSHYTIPKLKQLSPRELESCGRLVEPVLHTKETNRYTPISWEDALGRIADKLKASAPSDTFWYFSGRSSNEAGFLLQLFARLYGTNNVNNCSYYCHQASGVGLTSVTGSGTATLVLDDLEESDLIFVIGGNPASNHPRLMRTLMDARRRGAEVIVINPVIETGMVNFSVPSDVRSLLFGAEIASLYVQPHIGGDLALLYAIAKRIQELDAADETFLTEHCQGWPELRSRLLELDYEELERKSGVSREEINRIADLYAKSKRAVFSWTMGITHHANGVDNVQAIGALALMRGMVGRPGAGLMPIRGHSNVQGVGSVGVTPKLKDTIFQNLTEHYGLRLPTDVGLDTLGCMDEAIAGKMRLGFCLGGNLYGSNPDSQYAERSLAEIDTLVYMSTTLNTGHAWGLGKETIILPVLARDEEPEPTTQESMFNFVRLSEGGPRRHEGPRSEVQVVSDIASRVFDENFDENLQDAAKTSNNPVDWGRLGATEEIRKMIARVVPGFDQLATIGESKTEFQIEGRTFHEPKFKTSDGRAQLHVHDLPELRGGPEELRLMTVRSEGQFNTVVYEEEDLYRGIERRDVILLNPTDIKRLGLKENSRVTVTGPAGKMEHILATPFEKIKAGNALMYYPESNVLVDRQIDPKSKTPAFKCVLVQISSQSNEPDSSPT